MSAAEHVQRCRAMLEDQLEQLAGLRNANPRDPGFKLWRQNTLTVLQRVWPGDSARSEPFRRISFTPPHARADGQTMREWYSRGCAEAGDCLTALMARIDRDGVPAATEGHSGSAQAVARGNDDDVPMLDLPSSQGRTPANQSPDSRPAPVDASAMPGTEAGREAGSPAPPQLRMPVKPAVAAPAQVPASTPPPLALEPPPAPPTIEPPLAIEPAPEPLAIEPTPTPSAAIKLPPPVAPAAAEVPPPAPIAPVAPAAADAPAPAPRAAAKPAAPAPLSRPARGRKASARQKPRLKDMLGLDILEASGAFDVTQPAANTPSTPAVSAPTANTEPAPLASAPPAIEPPAIKPPAPEPPALSDAEQLARDEPMDEATRAQAADDFLRNSPVLGLQGRPVQRASDDTGFMEPDAVAIATLATDAGRLGVPEPLREAVCEQLREVAGQVERHDLTWTTLQGVTQVAMEFPALARRLLPILLPWLDRAA